MGTRRDIDEQVVRDRRDPRREDSVPPEKRASAKPRAEPDAPPAVAAVEAAPIAETLKPEPIEGPPLAKSEPPLAKSEPPLAKSEPAPKSTPRSTTDPRLEEVEAARTTGTACSRRSGPPIRRRSSRRTSG